MKANEQINLTSAIKMFLSEEPQKTLTTFEVLGFSKKFKSVGYKNFDERISSFGDAFFEELDLIVNPNKKRIEDPARNEREIKAHRQYILSMYADMYKQMLELKKEVETFKKNITSGKYSLESRQFVISFERLHCFESMQFIRRDYGSRHLIIINMRSCNLYDNFLFDLYFGFKCGLEIFRPDWMPLKGDFNPDIIINIGSLHIFMEEGKQEW